MGGKKVERTEWDVVEGAKMKSGSVVKILESKALLELRNQINIHYSIFFFT